MDACKHLNSRCYGNNSLGFFQCLDCDREVNMGEVFDNWLKEFQQMRNEWKQSLPH